MIHYCANCARTIAAEDAYTVLRTLPLTSRESAIYDYLRIHIHEYGCAPSFAEIARRFGYKSLATVHEHLVNLQRKGWVRREFNRSRAITCLVDVVRAEVAQP